MTMPLDPNQANQQEGPVSWDMLMSLRQSAQGKSGLQGAAERRLGTNNQQDIVPGQTPDDVMLSDIEEQENASIEPPDIPQGFATTMMRYGAIQDYLMRAQGQIPNG